MQKDRYSYAYSPPPRNRRVRLRPRFFILLVIMIGLLIFALSRLFGLPFTDAVVTVGELKFGKQYRALLVRQEKCYSTDSYGSITYEAGEGEDVNEGDVVLSVYATTNIDKLLGDLEQVRTNITDYVQQDSVINKIIDKDLETIDVRINDITEEITALVRSRAKGTLLKTERALRDQMEQREDYIKKTAGARSDTTLSRLYERQSTLLTQIDASRTQYKAPEEGRVSFYFDYLELLLSPETVDKVTARDVRDILDEKIKPRPSKQMLYRLVKTNDWYALLISPKSEWEVAVGQSCKVSFDGYDDLSMTASVTKLTVEDDDALVILKLQGDGAPLINTRAVHIDVGGSAKGLIVPLSAIKKSGDTDIVTLKEDATIVPVRIIGHDGRKAVVEPVEAGALKEGMPIVGR